MSSRRLLLVSEHYQPSTGATAQLMTDLARGLVHEGWRVSVLTSTPGQRSTRDEAPVILRLNLAQGSRGRTGVISKIFRGVRFFISSMIWCLFKAQRGDVVMIVSNPPFIGLLGPLIRAVRGLPYVFLYQDLFPRTAIISGVLPAAGPLTGSWRWLMGIVCRQSATTIVLSDSMRKRLLRDQNQPLPLSVIPNWAVERGLSESRANNPFAAEYGFHQRFTLQYSGNYGRLHDLLTFLETARILKPHPLQFVFIGGGAKQAQIDVYQEAFQLDNVLRLPYQPRETLPYSLGACDLAAIGLVPGGEDTMAPCKFYGILASGRGVVLVARRECDLAQLVLKKHIGVVVEPGESDELAQKLLQLSEDPAEVQAMGRRAQMVYEQHFGRQRSVQAYSSLLERIR